MKKILFLLTFAFSIYNNVYAQDEILNFSIVEEKPIYAGCEDVSKSERYVCFQQGIMNHISSNIIYPPKAKKMGVSESIFVQFIINTEGIVTNAEVIRGNDISLKREALRLVKSIPVMIPAKYNGEFVPCSFTIPINFRLQ